MKKDCMKAEKFERQSSEMHFHRHAYFLAQGCSLNAK